MTAKRAAALAELPAFRESGIDYETGTWFGVPVPTGTPRENVTTLHAEITGILRLPDVQERITGEGADSIGNTPAEFQAFIKNEAAKVAKVVKAVKITVN